MKNQILLTLVIIITFSVLCFSSSSGFIQFYSPAPEDIWVGKQRIELKINGLNNKSFSSVEVYLNGKLIKELGSRPYVFYHDFGSVPKNYKLTALVTQNQYVKLRTEIHSYQFDDFRNVDVHQVLVPVAVLDSNGNYIQDLKQHDFRIEVEGIEQPINYFESKGSAKFNLVLLMDISKSMRDKIGKVKEEGKMFVENLMTANDRAMVVFFNHVVFEESEFTNNVSELYSAISIAFPYGATALYDAIAYCIKQLKTISGRNIIILFSDGEDNSSAIDPYTLMKVVEKSNSVIYSIGQEMNTYTQYKELLKKISSQSGGIAFFINDVNEIEKIYDKIKRDIRAQYLLQFSPQRIKRRNRFRKIKLVLKNRSGNGYKIRSIKGFYY